MRTYHSLCMVLGYCLVLAVCLATQAMAADWPMWRYAASRSAASPAELPAELHLHWVRQLPTPRPAWPQQADDATKMQFDYSYAPIVMGTTLFVPSMTQDSLTAYDTATGAERWRFYANGPVRLAPAAWQGKVYVVSDDGHLYCLDAENGAVRWQFRGAPSERTVLGNERLISMWPARGGPVVKDGIVYFSAGIWPFMGIFIYALEADSGRIVWANTGSGATYTRQQHDTPAFAGLSPQGYLAVTDDTLLLSGGRSEPAGLDRTTGALRFIDLGNRAFGKSAGGYSVSAVGEHFISGTGMYRSVDGTSVIPVNATVFADNAMIGMEKNKLVGYAPRPERHEVEAKDRQGNTIIRQQYALRKLWEATPSVALETVMLQAGTRVYGSGKNGLVAAVNLPQGDAPATVSWHGTVDGEVWTMLAADNRLFVVTLQGAIYCFGAEEVEAPRRHALTQSAVPSPDAWTRRAGDILRETGVTGGYSLVLGDSTCRLAEELARQSSLHVIVMEADPRKAATLRQRYAQANLYGTRIAVFTGTPDTISLPPYLAELIVMDESQASVEKIFHALRPYGGVICLPLPAQRQQRFASLVAEAKLPNANVSRAGAFALLTRAGALPGTSDWTHQYADTGNTAFSPDTVVRAPLGPLWFGGPTNHNVLPRHGHGPIPQVVGGRLIIMGPHSLSARDVYTGRTLWEASLPEIGKAYNNTAHQPGANALGSNYISMHDGIYLHQGNAILRLDPATGQTLSTFRLPVEGDVPPPLGYIGAWEDLLILTVEPQIFTPEHIGRFNLNATTSRRLLVINRYTGAVLWSLDAEQGIRHNAIVAGNGLVFFIDRLPETVLATMQRRGELEDDRPEMLACDIRTGDVRWRTTEQVFGTWLGYSAAHDVLIQSGRPSTDMLRDEPRDRIIAYRGHDGAVRWNREFAFEGPLILHGERIIPTARNGRMLHLHTGEVVTRRHPLTGEVIPWSHSRTYGCGSAIASEHLLTFRSGAAGYYNLQTDEGTGNFGGFRAGCTNNLVVANGVLNAPDYTRTCACSYQIQTSLALVPMPEVETWTWSTLPSPSQETRVQQVGINFGAPGDRLADDGTLWLDYPSVGGDSPNIPVTVDADGVTWFRQHTSLMEGDGLNWVAASGLQGDARITLTLAHETADARAYTVRLYFAEPEDRAAGERVFSVALQGQVVLPNFDIMRETGKCHRGIVREFRGVAIKNELTVTLSQIGKESALPVLCGIAVNTEE